MARNRFNLIVFEDDQASDFYPLNDSHPVFDLLLGCHTFLDRLCLHFKPVSTTLICRRYLAELARLRHAEFEINEIKPENSDYLIVNAALKPDINVFKELLNAKNDSIFVGDGVLLGGKLSKSSVKRFADWILSLPENPTLPNFNVKEKPWTKYRNLWDMVADNGRIIELDFEYLKKSRTIVDQYKLKSNIMIHKKAKVGGGVFLDTAAGPIIIDRGARIDPRSLIQGPAYIGPDCLILSGIVREGCSLGPVCKVGGELEESIMLGYSNKCHEGFIGHSYIGEWVNLGALTTNSDLKNNYTTIKIHVHGREVDTGLIKVGSLIGDHTKTGIGTLFNTGIVVGFCCNLYGGGLFMQREVTPYSWGTPKSTLKFELDKAIQIAKTAMARRSVNFTEAHEKLFETLFEKYNQEK